MLTKNRKNGVVNPEFKKFCVDNPEFRKTCVDDREKFSLNNFSGINNIKPVDLIGSSDRTSSDEITRLLTPSPTFANLKRTHNLR